MLYILVLFDNTALDAGTSGRDAGRGAFTESAAGVALVATAAAASDPATTCSGNFSAEGATPSLVGVVSSGAAVPAACGSRPAAAGATVAGIELGELVGSEGSGGGAISVGTTGSDGGATAGELDGAELADSGG